jgi:hypothetical protein
VRATWITRDENRGMARGKEVYRDCVYVPCSRPHWRRAKMGKDLYHFAGLYTIRTLWETSANTQETSIVTFDTGSRGDVVISCCHYCLTCSKAKGRVHMHDEMLEAYASNERALASYRQPSMSFSVRTFTLAHSVSYAPSRFIPFHPIQCQSRYHPHTRRGPDRPTSS